MRGPPAALTCVCAHNRNARGLWLRALMNALWHRWTHALWLRAMDSPWTCGIHTLWYAHCVWYPLFIPPVVLVTGVRDTQSQVFDPVIIMIHPTLGAIPQVCTRCGMHNVWYV